MLSLKLQMASRAHRCWGSCQRGPTQIVRGARVDGAEMWVQSTKCGDDAITTNISRRALLE